MTPKVSFVILCYKLAHLLDDCVRSILAQSYTDFEVLIMDDASPDNTPEVAQSFRDPRVRHIRNNPNLGWAGNYNKGVGMARGKYIWIISADDLLRRPYVLERYVRLLDAHSNVGYVFCPAIELRDGHEVGIIPDNYLGPQDRVLSGHDFLIRLGKSDCVSAPSVLARKVCYTTLGGPVADLPHSGDYYLWCLFCLRYDVAYMAEPMALYRRHDLNIRLFYEEKNPHLATADNIAMYWRIKEIAAKLGFTNVIEPWLNTLAAFYADRLARKTGLDWPLGITWPIVEETLAKHATPAEQADMRTRINAALPRWHEYVGDLAYAEGKISNARHCYGLALRQKPWNLSIQAKFLSTCLGASGQRLRQISSHVKHATNI